MDRRIFLIQDLLSQSLDRCWTVKEMATTVRLSVPHFNKLFRSEIGCSPIAYLHRIRLAKARELLSEPGCFLQIKEIALKVGMPNASQFSREFRKLTGLSPAGFRKKFAEIEQLKPPSAQE